MEWYFVFLTAFSQLISSSSGIVNLRKRMKSSEVQKFAAAPEASAFYTYAFYFKELICKDSPSPPFEIYKLYRELVVLCYHSLCWSERVGAALKDYTGVCERVMPAGNETTLASAQKRKDITRAYQTLERCLQKNFKQLEITCLRPESFYFKA